MKQPAQYIRQISFRVMLLSFGLLTVAAAQAEDGRSVDAMIDDVVRTAESYLGTPHRLGGMTKRGIDCSGLMVVSFQAAGIALPRTSGEQARVGDKVRDNQLQRGDLVFFSSRGRVNHVGLVTKASRGDVWFIHTSSSRGVMVSNLSEAYWRDHYSSARRVWDEPHVGNTRPGAPVVAAVPGTYPEASIRKLKRREIKRMPERQAELMQAEIWARNGYRFRDDALQTYFDRQPWYQSEETTRWKFKAKGNMDQVEKKNLRRLRRIKDLEKVK